MVVSISELLVSVWSDGIVWFGVNVMNSMLVVVSVVVS